MADEYQDEEEYTMEHRGMAYRVAPYAPPQAKTKADVYVQ